MRGRGKLRRRILPDREKGPRRRGPFETAADSGLAEDCDVERAVAGHVARQAPRDAARILEILKGAAHPEKKSAEDTEGVEGDAEDAEKEARRVTKTVEQ